MRAIDADALKEDLTRFYDNEVTARKLIDEQPTIQPEPHWIPVEQELPEQDEICLVCGKNGGIYVARFWRNESLVLWTKTGTGKFVNAVAWMPLPPVYQGE